MCLPLTRLATTSTYKCKKVTDADRKMEFVSFCFDELEIPQGTMYIVHDNFCLSSAISTREEKDKWKK